MSGGFPRRGLPVVLAALCLALAACQAGKKADTRVDVSEPVLRYSDWTTRNFKGVDGKPHYASSTNTVEVASGLLRELAVDWAAGGCKAKFFRIMIALPKPMDKDFVSEKLPGEMRIDDQAPISLTYQYKIGKGKDFIILYTSEVLTNDVTRSAVSNGQMVSFKVTVEGAEYKLRFTLRNHVAAMRHSAQDCMDAASFAPPKGAAAPPSGPHKQGQPGLPPAPPVGDKGFF